MDYKTFGNTNIHILSKIKLNKLIIHWTHINPKINKDQDRKVNCPECTQEPNYIDNFYECTELTSHELWNKSLSYLNQKHIIPPICDILKFLIRVSPQRSIFGTIDAYEYKP